MSNKKALVNLYKDCVGDLRTRFLYDIVYQQQHKNRDPKYYLSDTSVYCTIIYFSTGFGPAKSFNTYLR